MPLARPLNGSPLAACSLRPRPNGRGFALGLVLESACAFARKVVMRRGSYISTVALTGVLALPCSQQRSGAQVGVGIFYDRLAPDGEWLSPGVEEET